MKPINILPELEYEYNSLEPFIDEKTMKIHHTKHHQNYVDKLNKSLEKYPELLNKPAEELLKNLSEIPEEIRINIINNGGGHANHSFFWKVLKKDTEMGKEILNAINSSFGNFENFKKEYSESASSLFGSGWTWLVFNNGKLEIINTKNQDSPLSENKTPLLNMDLWEHSYYLKYQNKRADYIESFFKIINWDFVNKNFAEAKKLMIGGEE